MPLVYVTLAEGTTSQDQRAQIGDGIYRALIDVANVPEDDRFQVINEVPSTNLIYSPDYMGFGRTRSVMCGISSSTARRTSSCWRTPVAAYLGASPCASTSGSSGRRPCGS